MNNLKEIQLKLYNTETKEKHTVHPIDGKTIKLYTCGPTVYNFAHIGNFRTYVAEDLLRRSLLYFGLPVEQVMNITDVDDKTIKGAIEKGTSLIEYAEPYTQAFFDDLKTLNIEKVEHYPKATDYIQEMINMIEDLIKKGFAYVGQDKSVYFSISSFSSYGRLSHLKLKELKTGASNRIDDEYDKDNASDFVLWKAYDETRDGNIYWESPWGKGRPGWHLECSAMATKILGESIDIHCGGVDNIFPHHENEIAQSECCTGKQFAKLWFHVEHLIVDNKKMSKSLGNFYTLRNLLDKGYSGRQVRYLLLQTHYKTQLNFTFEGLDGARASLDRIDAFVERLSDVEGSGDKECGDTISEQEKVFAEAIADDLNISQALASLFDLIRKGNAFIDAKKMDKQQASKLYSLLEKFDQVLGLIFYKEEKEDIDQEILEALDKREQARKDKNYALADELRDFIHSRGYEIEDTPKGARVIRGKNVQTH